MNHKLNNRSRPLRTSDTSFLRFKGIFFPSTVITKEIQIIGVISKRKKLKHILLCRTVGLIYLWGHHETPQGPTQTKYLNKK